MNKIIIGLFVICVLIGSISTCIDTRDYRRFGPPYRVGFGGSSGYYPGPYESNGYYPLSHGYYVFGYRPNYGHRYGYNGHGHGHGYGHGYGYPYSYRFGR
ncbi:keratin-associated protein 19-2-like [Panonychus citri]|uniref:keratin-associated protein 19-2-like n=1 Tax=Panonychus citri TaxID=50023 RepID=UPI002307CCDD|nr:keratin-associated protein 19-2-like [Panonychus citri]